VFFFFFFNSMCDVRDNALALVRSSVPAPCVLPLLFVFCRYRFSARRDRHGDAASY